MTEMDQYILPRLEEAIQLLREMSARYAESGYVSEERVTSEMADTLAVFLD